MCILFVAARWFIRGKTAPLLCNFGQLKLTLLRSRPQSTDAPHSLTIPINFAMLGTDMTRCTRVSLTVSATDLGHVYRGG
jgi:hypothetical protein